MKNKKSVGVIIISIYAILSFFASLLNFITQLKQIPKIEPLLLRVLNQADVLSTDTLIYAKITYWFTCKIAPPLIIISGIVWLIGGIYLFMHKNNGRTIIILLSSLAIISTGLLLALAFHHISLLQDIGGTQYTNAIKTYTQKLFFDIPFILIHSSIIYFLSRRKIKELFK